MADTTAIKNKIVIEGEAQYKKAIREITQALKEQRSALKAASAEYASAEGDMRDASRVSKAFEQTIEQQGIALAEMEKHLKEVEKAYAEAGEKLSTLEKGTEEYKKLEAEMADCAKTASDVRIKINNMRTEMAKSQTQLREFRQGLENVEDSTGDAAQGIEELAQSAGKSEKEVASFADKLQELTGIDLPTLTISAAVAGLGAAAWQGLSLGNDETRAWSQMQAYTGATGEELDALMETAKALYTEAFGADLQEAVRGVAQLAQNTGLSGKELETTARSAFLLSEMLGYDVAESSRTARMLMEKFGVSGQEAYDIMATAAQDGADKNGNLLDTINEYAPYFAEAGFSAEEFGRALVNATENGVYDVDKVGDGFKEFTLRMKEGSGATKAALTGLGIEATDIGYKFAQGGETAREATELVIRKLMEMEDPIKRNEYGVALFGTQWEDTSGAVVDCIDDVEGGLGDTQTALDNMNKARMSDLDVALAGLARRVSSIFAEFTSPAAKEAAEFINGVSEWLDTGETSRVPAVTQESSAADKAANPVANGVNQALGVLRGNLLEGNLLPGLIDAGVVLVGGVVQGIDVAMTEAVKAAWNAALATFFNSESLDLEENAKLYAQTHESAVAAQLEQVYDQAADSEDYQAWKRFQQSMLDSAYDDTVQGAGQMGEDAAQATVEGIEDGEGDAQAVGEDLGEAAVDGAEDGLDGMEDAAKNSVDGLIGSLGSAEGRAYDKGYAAGKAFERGYKAAQQIASPAKVMVEAAAFSVEGLLDPLEEAESEVYARGAALGEALESGYAGAQGGQIGAGTHAGGGTDISLELLTQAFREALSDLALTMDGEHVGGLTAGGVSRTISRAGTMSLAGVTARAKGW